MVVKGAVFDRLAFQHPLYDRPSIAVLADYVTLDAGTGVVHTAPGHGREDFMTGQEFGLPVLSPVDASGHFTKEAGPFAGMDLKTAAGGFKNQGQFIAALHVSKNLGIPFTDLKSKMTGSNPESLGQAIHDLKPTLSQADAQKEAEKAQKQARTTEKTAKPIS